MTKPLNSKRWRRKELIPLLNIFWVPYDAVNVSGGKSRQGAVQLDFTKPRVEAHFVVFLDASLPIHAEYHLFGRRAFLLHRTAQG